ncbi:hypothetical protein [Nostoc sp.]
MLATAIDGKAGIIVSGDDDDLRGVMASYSIQLLGVYSFLKYLDEGDG